MKAVKINEHGGPEALKYQDVAGLEPGAGESLGGYASGGR